MSTMNEGQLGGGLADAVSTLKTVASNLSAIYTTMQNLLPRVAGTFTLSAATTTFVAQTSVGNNFILGGVIPTNATAALVVRTNGLFHASSTAGSGFTMSTQSGSATSGGTFEYVGVNLV